MLLDHELQVYGSHLVELLGPDNVNEGKYTAIKAEDIIGPFEDYGLALKAAYDRFGIGGFLVRKIEQVETILAFTRDLR